MNMILAEELLLLVLHSEKGTFDSGFLDPKPGLAGALVLDLAAAGAVQVDDDGKLEAVPGAQVEHPVLRATYEEIAGSDKLRSVKSWVGRLPGALKPMDDRIADGLAQRGVLQREEVKMLGLFNATKYPEVDPAPERELRERMGAVLRSERQPTPQEATLIALLRAYDRIPKLVAKEDRKAAKARAKEVADQGIAGRAVEDTVKAAQYAIVALIAASAAGAGAGAG